MYNNSKEQALSILDIWNIIEVLTPAKSEKLAQYLRDAQKIEDDHRQFAYDTEKKETLFLLEDEAFLEDKNKYIPVKKDYVANIYWHAYIGYLNWTEAEIAIQTKIEQVFGKGKLNPNACKNKNNPTICPIAGFIMNENGNLFPNSIVISSGAWALGKILNENFEFETLRCFREESNKIIQFIKSIILTDTQESSSLDFLQIKNLRNILLAELQLDNKFLMRAPEFCIRKVEIIKKAQAKRNEAHNSPPPLEMFNSFFLEEIELVKKDINQINSNSAIGKCLGLPDKPYTQNVLSDNTFLKKLFNPSLMQASRWPSSIERSLAALQATALNAIFKQKEEDNHLLFAINGPPGTGKTTLMAELIANLYIKRAKILAGLNSPKNGFENKNQQEKNPSFTYNIKEIIPALKGFEIVVASSNNNAVENISKQLPLKANIDENFQTEINFFKWLTTNNTADESWGIFCAALGKFSNIQNFLKNFWQQEFTKPGEVFKANPPTMFHYLNLLKKDKKAYIRQLKDLKPKYCNSEKSIEEKWQKSRLHFNKLLAQIEKIYNEISILTIKNKEKQSILKKFGNINLNDALAEEKQLINKYDQELEFVLNEIESKDLEIQNLHFGPFLFIAKFFNTEKFQIFSQNKLRLKQNKGKLLELRNQLLTRKRDCDTKIEQIEVALREINKIDEYLIPTINILKKWEFNIEELKNEAFWKNSYEQLHQFTPYVSTRFEKLRTTLFTAALKLHEIFINANAHNFWNSLKLFCDVLGSPMRPSLTPQVIKSAWHNFFMIVPVISTTLHSYGRMLNSFSKEEVGWLIIDEAGQVPPQYAIGAIYRTRNVVIVGDPLQTEPISILAEQLIAQLFERNKLSPKDWSPAEVSMQNIADRNSIYQTSYGNGVMVGFPLLVHRRCQEPMFSICNNLAYDNKMISAVKNIPSPIGEILGKSKWIDIIDNNPQESIFFSYPEFLELTRQLNKLFQISKSPSLLKKIYIISFYRNYSTLIKENLEKHFLKHPFIKEIKKFCQYNIGTIHAFQGREEDTVICMLGAQHPKDYGARNIMTDIPNVINVGISRAQRNLYIIGNMKIWKKHANMKLVIDMLHNYSPFLDTVNENEDFKEIA